MNRRSLLKALALSPLAWLFSRPSEAKPLIVPVTVWHSSRLAIWHSDQDIVIAHSAEDAAELFDETTGPWTEGQSEGLDEPCPGGGAHDLRLSETGFGGLRVCRHPDCIAYNMPKTPGLIPENWKKWPDDKPFTLTFDEAEPDFCEMTARDVLNGAITFVREYHDGVTTFTVEAYPRWWATNFGRGYLGSKDG